MTPRLGHKLFLSENILVREMMKSLSVLGLVLRLIFPQLHLSFIVQMDCELQSMLNVSIHHMV